MPEIFDVLNDDSFSLNSMTESFLNRDHVPGRAGALAFAGVGRGLMTTTAQIEVRDDTLTLIQSQPRGAPAAREGRRKRRLLPLSVPHFPLDDTIKAEEVRNVRQMGMADAVLTVQALMNQQLDIMSQAHDLTLENLRLGALLGIIYDADGTVLTNTFTAFGVTAETAVSFELDVSTTDVRGLCQDIRRTMVRNAKTQAATAGRIHAFCGDDFFDALISHPNVEQAFAGYAEAAQRLGGDYTWSQFPFGGITFENYRGTDNLDGDNNTVDGGGVGLDPSECRFFFTGVPGMYAEYYAPGDFLDSIGSVGLPRYARTAVDPMGRFVDVHTEMNPLPICLRPKTLMRATLT